MLPHVQKSRRCQGIRRLLMQCYEARNTELKGDPYCCVLHTRYPGDESDCSFSALIYFTAYSVTNGFRNVCKFTQLKQCANALFGGKSYFITVPQLCLN